MEKRKEGFHMHKKKVQAAMLAMAILMSVSSPAAVLADTVSNSGQELEQEQEGTEEFIIEEILVEEEMLEYVQTLHLVNMLRQQIRPNLPLHRRPTQQPNLIWKF